MNDYAAIIPTAGLSSRMGDFKPLQKIGELTMIQRTVLSAVAGGVNRIYVVTGHRAADVEASLNSLRRIPEVYFVGNDNYETTDMLHSIKLGIHALLGIESSREWQEGNSVSAVFIIPGDVPAVSPKTFALLREEFERSNASVIVPTFSGKRGHPLLVSSTCLEVISSFNGSGGLRQALANETWRELEVTDRGILLDADYVNDVAVLRDYLSSNTNTLD